MLTINRKLLEFFVHIPKLEIDGSNWVIFKEHFASVAATTSLEKHMDSVLGALRAWRMWLLFGLIWFIT